MGSPLRVPRLHLKIHPTRAGDPSLERNRVGANLVEFMNGHIDALQCLNIEDAHLLQG